jgi:16S rRNA (cytosine1402-N4)-methyltransferase
VLLAEVIAALGVSENGIYLDATFGAGGYSRAILGVPGTRVLALDRDPDAIAGGKALVEAAGGCLNLQTARFSELAHVAVAQGMAALDGVVLDIGVSSMQVDTAERGFSFRLDGPLDMRMERAGPSAADLVNETPEEDLANIIYRYGEERLSRRIARVIAIDRRTKPFTRTRDLAELVARIVPHKPTDPHPATRTFQALRIAVNDELGELERALEAAESVLRPGGRLVVVTFHSLEDRLVKQFFAARTGRGRARSRLLPGEPVPPEPTFTLVGPQPVVAGPDEITRNPRARSAKLRAGVRTDTPVATPTSERALSPHRPNRGRR